MSLVRFRLWAFVSLKLINGALAQVVEHLTFNQVVRGSSPRCLINSSRVISMNLLVTRFFVFEEVKCYDYWIYYCERNCCNLFEHRN